MKSKKRTILLSIVVFATVFLLENGILRIHNPFITADHLCACYPIENNSNIQVV
ncbi:hypothetical protein ACFVS2_25560 [Brevibacillus sp. NPDC058079]|uniref:hypothetical protein n=1 Tax=Brevibacillus sp. NPDC058079 TaxID=3346330 RepID=UPI0036EF05AA